LILLKGLSFYCHANVYKGVYEPIIFMMVFTGLLAEVFIDADTVLIFGGIIDVAKYLICN